jgi:transposase
MVLHRGGRMMTVLREAFVGIDAAKMRNAVAIADAGRDGEVRYIGEIDASPDSMKRFIGKLTRSIRRETTYIEC